MPNENRLLEPSVFPPRTHPATRALFKSAEARHLNNEELAEVAKAFPDRAHLLAAAREIREKDVAIIGRVVKEVFAQYPYEKNHEYASAKCPRDTRYVVAYAVLAMISGEPRWFEDKVLLWLKTILQAFDFPDRIPVDPATFTFDDKLEAKLKTLPRKARSIYHLYYRLKPRNGQVVISGKLHLDRAVSRPGN